MARRRSILVDWLGYLALRSLVCAAQAISWPMALSCAKVLAGLVYRFDRRHRQVAEDNIRHAFPDLAPEAVQSLARRSLEHLFQMVFEIIRLPRVVRHSNVNDYFQYLTPAEFQRAIDFGSLPRPRLLLTGHFGNWESLSYAIGLVGFRGSLVARRIDNPYIDAFIKDFRRATGQTILDKSEDYGKMIEAMERGEALGLVGDQDAGPRGLFVPFMGRPASTYKSIALLSLEYSAPIMVMCAARIEWPLRYRVYVEDIIDPLELENHPDPVRAITQRYAEAMERVVRRHPEQYFWVHRRWKHQPKEAKKKMAA